MSSLVGVCRVMCWLYYNVKEWYMMITTAGPFAAGHPLHPPSPFIATDRFSLEQLTNLIVEITYSYTRTQLRDYWLGIH